MGVGGGGDYRKGRKNKFVLHDKFPSFGSVLFYDLLNNRILFLFLEYIIT